MIQLRKGVQHLHEGWIWSCAGGWSHAFCPAPLTVRDINIHYRQPNSLSAFFSWTFQAWSERRIIRPKKRTPQIKSEQHWQSSGRRPMSPERLCPWCALIQGASLNSRQSATKNAALSHPPPFEITHSHLCWLLACEVCWAPSTLLCLPRDSEGYKGRDLNVSCPAQSDSERLEVERTPMRSSLTSLGSNLGLFPCILLSGALSSSAVT